MSKISRCLLLMLLLCGPGPPAQAGPDDRQRAAEARRVRAWIEALATQAPDARRLLEDHFDVAIPALHRCRPGTAAALGRLYSQGRLPEARRLMAVISRPGHGEDAGRFVALRAGDFEDPDRLAAFEKDAMLYCCRLRDLDDGAEEVRAGRSRPYRIGPWVEDWRCLAVGVAIAGVLVTLLNVARRRRAAGEGPAAGP